MTQVQLDPAKVQKVVKRLLCGLLAEDIYEMAAMYGRCYSTKKIGDKMGLTAVGTARILRRVGVPLRRIGAQTVLTPKIREAAKKMLAEGKSARAAAIAVGVAPSTLSRALREGTL